MRQFKNERALGLVLENNYTVVFKLFGNRSNAVVFQGDNVIDLFHNRLVSDNNLHLSELDREIDQNWEAYQAANYDHRKVFPTFGKEINAYLAEQFDATPAPSGYSPDQRWQIIQETLNLLSRPAFKISLWHHQPTLTLVALGEVMREHTNAITALNDFYTTYNRVGVIAKEKGDALKILQKRIQRTEHYLEEAFQKLLGIDGEVKNEEIGHILMANLHQIPERAERVTLFDFYRNQDIEIKLKPDLTPQRNAETYYRKSKNERIEIEKLQENIALRKANWKNSKIMSAPLSNLNHSNFCANI